MIKHRLSRAVRRNEETGNELSAGTSSLAPASRHERALLLARTSSAHQSSPMMIRNYDFERYSNQLRRIATCNIPYSSLRDLAKSSRLPPQHFTTVPPRLSQETLNAGSQSSVYICIAIYTAEVRCATRHLSSSSGAKTCRSHEIGHCAIHFLQRVYYKSLTPPIHGYLTVNVLKYFI